MLTRLQNLDPMVAVHCALFDLMFLIMESSIVIAAKGGGLEVWTVDKSTGQVVDWEGVSLRACSLRLGDLNWRAGYRATDELQAARSWRGHVCCKWQSTEEMDSLDKAVEGEDSNKGPSEWQISGGCDDSRAHCNQRVEDSLSISDLIRGVYSFFLF